jgi:hypothetical protein
MALDSAYRQMDAKLGRDKPCEADGIFILVLFMFRNHPHNLVIYTANQQYVEYSVENKQDVCISETISP